jgi:hypothetical protein
MHKCPEVAPRIYYVLILTPTATFAEWPSRPASKWKSPRSAYSPSLPRSANHGRTGLAEPSVRGVKDHSCQHGVLCISCGNPGHGSKYCKEQALGPKGGLRRNIERGSRTHGFHHTHDALGEVRTHSANNTGHPCIPGHGCKRRSLRHYNVGRRNDRGN